MYLTSIGFLSYHIISTGSNIIKLNDQTAHLIYLFHNSVSVPHHVTATFMLSSYLYPSSSPSLGLLRCTNSFSQLLLTLSFNAVSHFLLLSSLPSMFPPFQLLFSVIRILYNRTSLKGVPLCLMRLKTPFRFTS